MSKQAKANLRTAAALGKCLNGAHAWRGRTGDVAAVIVDGGETLHYVFGRIESMNAHRIDAPATDVERMCAHVLISTADPHMVSIDGEWMELS